MSTQGLLVENHNGQDFLLTTESRMGMKTHRLVVLQRINGKWQQLNGTVERECRESLMGEFVDLFVDICRVLNSPSPELAPATAPIARRARTRPALSIKPERNL
jgi:hypothetical protein